jgi:plasmid stability protein
MNYDYICNTHVLAVNKAMEIDMATLQVRSVDDQLYEALGKRAIRENRSISQEVIFILKAYLSSPPPKYQEVTDRFLEICGSWEDSREADEIVSEIRRSRQPVQRPEVEF